MSKITIFIVVLFFLNHCSLNKNSKIWNNDENEENFINKESVKKLFVDEEIISNEFNIELAINLSKINYTEINNRNDYGSQNYKGLLNKEATLSYSKLGNIKKLDYKPAFLNDGLVFFDKKGAITKYYKKKIIWKKNYYNKSEKKLKPKLYFAVDNENLLVVDNIAKYYSINLDTGKLNWSKNSIYPFNSEIKISQNKFFAIDYNNTLRCFNIMDGSECWNIQTEEAFTISGSKFSLIILKNLVVFNNSIGDITAVDINSGLIKWQLPTQSKSIINKTYKFRLSKLVSDGKSIFFSNNMNEFYSIDAMSGTINWKNKINSNLTPIISENLIITISNNGYLFVIQKNEGNIVRITDLYKSYKANKKDKIIPIGFAIGKNSLYLTSNNSKMIVVDLEFGKVVKEIKISGKLVSSPLIFNEKLFLIKSGSIIRYN